jgi:hypothetical protein
MKMKALAGAVAVPVTSLLLSSREALAQGCAMCRTAVEGQDDPLTRGLSHSVLFMVSMPFAVFFSAAGWLVISNIRAKAALPMEGPSPAPEAGPSAGEPTVTEGV